MILVPNLWPSCNILADTKPYILTLGKWSLEINFFIVLLLFSLLYLKLQLHGLTNPVSLFYFAQEETPEQREGAFSNFRISPVTINKLKGEYQFSLSVYVLYFI